MVLHFRGTAHWRALSRTCEPLVLWNITTAYHRNMRTETSTINTVLSYMDKLRRFKKIKLLQVGWHTFQVNMYEQVSSSTGEHEQV